MPKQTIKNISECENVVDNQIIIKNRKKTDHSKESKTTRMDLYSLFICFRFTLYKKNHVFNYQHETHREDLIHDVGGISIVVN